jgi:hypothetical protein
LIEGIVFNKIICDDNLVTWEDLEKYHKKYLVKNYREFWKDTAYSQVRSSESFNFPDVNDSDANLESITPPSKQLDSTQLEIQLESPTEKSDSLECLECIDNLQINGETQSSHQDDQKPILLKILGCPIFLIFILLKKLFGK